MFFLTFLVFGSSKASIKAIFFSSLVNPTTRFVNALVYASVALVVPLKNVVRYNDFHSATSTIERVSVLVRASVSARFGENAIAFFDLVKGRENLAHPLLLSYSPSSFETFFSLSATFSIDLSNAFKSLSPRSISDNGSFAIL